MFSSTQLKINQKSFISCPILHFETDFLWKVSLKILNYGLFCLRIKEDDVSDNTAHGLLSDDFLSFLQRTKINTNTNYSLYMRVFIMISE